MKHNFMTKMVSALLAVVLSTAAFSITAFASGGEESTESVTEQETVGDVSDLLSALAGSQVTVSVTEDGIQFSSGENDSGQASHSMRWRRWPVCCCLRSKSFTPAKKGSANLLSGRLSRPGDKRPSDGLRAVIYIKNENTRRSAKELLWFLSYTKIRQK